MFARSLKFFGVASLFLVSIAVTAKSGETKTPEVVPGQFVVEFTTSVSDARLLTVERSLGSVVDRINDSMVLIQRDPGEASEKALQLIRSASFVRAADPNFIMHASRTPNDPGLAKLWGMANDGTIVDSTGIRALKGIDIGAAKAWDQTTGSSKIVVAIIDTGIDFKIPDLAPNAWTNLAEANGKTGIDDDANGYIDDIHGFNFSTDVATADPTDDNGHGSHCAGTIGARGDDGAGVAGVSWNVSLMAVKFLDANGSGTLVNAIKAIDYARKNGANILSNSWGGGQFTQTLFDAITATQKAGELFIAAAGNDSNNNDTEASYPASYKIDNIISVAAIDQRGELADFSNYGATSVHIAAPGVAIYSTAPTAIVPEGFQTMSGTSMATPHVAGAAALVWSTDPAMTYTEVKKRILAGARPLHGLRGKTVTGGMLDVSYALSGLTPPADPNDPTVWTNSSPQKVSSPHPYGDKLAQTYTVTVPGAARVSLHFAKFETENNYDVIRFYDKAGSPLGVMSGTRTGEFSPIAEGDTIVMKFTSDDSVNGYGIDVDRAVYVTTAPTN